MVDLSPDICRRMAEARRTLGLSQSELATIVGCKQPALSMFEGGNPTKLSEETVKKLAEKLGVKLVEPAVAANVVAKLPLDGVRGFCPNHDCLSNVPYLVGDKVYFKPMRSMAAPAYGRRCAICGEFLEFVCPTCGSPLNDGGCCGICGSPYVAFVPQPGVAVDGWIRGRRAQLIELRDLAWSRGDGQ